MKVKELKVPIYNARLRLILTDDLSKLNERYNFNILPNDYDAVTFKHNVDSTDLVFYVAAFEIGKFKNKFIAHEVVHLVNLIYLDHGIELDRVNDEPQAYLTGFLFEKIEKFIKSKDNKNER